MQKSTINFGGMDFIVRTIDLRSLPGYESDAYAAVRVATDDLWRCIGDAVMGGDEEAERIDSQFIFYPEAEFIERDPTDEELLEYLSKHL